MAAAGQTSLISSSVASDSSPIVQLHPLVLLTVSDYITRHTLRRQKEPIFGAILGQQHGREITMEVAFECKPAVGDNDDEIIMDEDWFQARLDQCECAIAEKKLGNSLRRISFHVFSGSYDV